MCWLYYVMADCAYALTTTVAQQKIGVLKAWQCFVQTNGASEIASLLCVLWETSLKPLPPQLSVLALPSVGALPLTSQAAGKVKHFFKGTSVWHQGALWARTVLLWALDGASEGADSFPCSGGNLPPSPCSGLSSLSSGVKAFFSHLFVCT